MIDFNQLSALDWVGVCILVLTFIGSLYLGAIQFRFRNGGGLGGKERIKRSVVSGAVMSLLAISTFAIAEILDREHAWVLSQYLQMVICLIIPSAIFVAIFTYIRLGVVDRFREILQDRNKK